MTEWQDKFVPAWREVAFPRFRTIRYPTLEKANNGRIWARAWFNFVAEGNGGRKFYQMYGYQRGGWTDLARYLQIDKKPPYTMGIDGPATYLYRWVTAGRLPKDDAAKQRLFDLAGYPWK